MDKQYPYNPLIESKLEHLPGADVSQLWGNMQAILDKEMPQKEERPRFFAWLFSSKSLLMVGIASLLAVCGLALVHFTSKTSTPAFTKASIENNNTPATPKQEIRKENPSVSESQPAVLSTASEGKERETAAHFNSGNPALETRKSSSQSVVSGHSVKTKSSVRYSWQDNGNKEWSNLASGFEINGKGNTALSASGSQKENSIAVIYIPSIDHERLLQEGFLIQPLDSGEISNTTALKKLLQQYDSVAAINKPRKEDKEQGFYVGVMVGLDMSSIEFESMRTGQNTGIITGYSFNKRWSLETGLFWARKNYFGDGDYYNSGYTLPSNVKMLTVDGECRMYEWPVNVRYTVLSGKHRLFATTGLSSYYMKRESYEYEYERNGQYGKGFSTYKNESKNWLSVANFSLGYQHQLGGIGSIRVEPYLKLPLKNLGVYNLPITSMGINIGFTRNLFK